MTSNLVIWDFQDFLENLLNLIPRNSIGNFYCSRNKNAIIYVSKHTKGLFGSPEVPKVPKEALK